jgi:hypothetical protein
MAYMTRNTALICALTLLVACSEPIGPDSGTPAPDGPGVDTPPLPGSEVFTLQVTPTFGDLSTLEPGNTLYISVVARDQEGRELNTFGNGNPDGSYGHRRPLATFRASDPAVATVSSTGTVVGVAPGAAVITVALTLLGVTKHETVNIVVRSPSTPTGDYPDLTGSYDFEATFLGVDLDWSPGSGTRWTASLSIQHSSASPTFTGTFTDLQSIVPGGASYPVGSGSVRGQVDHDGRVAIQLSFGENSSVDFSGDGALVSDQIAGTFSSLYTGEFTATRTAAR